MTPQALPTFVGMELRNTLRQLRYDRGLAIVAMIFVLIVLVERVSSLVRGGVIGGEDLARSRLVGPIEALEQRRRDARGDRVVMPWTPVRAGQGLFLLVLVARLVASVQQLDLSLLDLLFAGPALLAMLGNMWPPDSVTNTGPAITGLGESLAIAVVSSFIGVIRSIPFAILGARTTAFDRISAVVARYGVVAVRGVPELILAIVFVAAVGLGPLAGALALCIGTIGLSAKLMMDALEQVPRMPMQAVTSTGATHTQMVSSSVILGIVGAGGIGFLLQSSVAQRPYERTAAMLIMIFVVVYGIEQLSTWLRRKVIG